MDNSKELKDCERIVKQIAKTNDSIHKKYHVLKISKIEEDIALEEHFKPIVEQIIENNADKVPQPIKKEANVAKDRNIKKRKPEENEKDDNEYDNDDNGDSFRMDNSWLQLTIV